MEKIRTNSFEYIQGVNIMKAAIVHDWLTNYGGAERVLQAIADQFPDAPIYTVVYDKEKMGGHFKNHEIRTTYIQKIPFGVKKYNLYLPLLPGAVERLDLTEYDLVISSSTCCAKGVLTRADAIHICYCATPMRYAWDFYFKYKNSSGGLKKLLIPLFMKGIRQWDVISSNRVDHFIANSKNVAKRIKKHYRRESQVIYPFADTEFFTPEGSEDKGYYFIVTRLVEYKRIDLAVKAFNKLGLPLIIAGEGRELANLKKIAKDNIKFTGRISNEEIREYYRGCKAFIFPGEEDFGITPVEAQSTGKPVIAFGKGGALETVIDGVTGVFFPQQTAESLSEAVERFQKLTFDPDVIRKNAENFSKAEFIRDFNNFVQDKINNG